MLTVALAWPVSVLLSVDVAVAVAVALSVHLLSVAVLLLCAAVRLVDVPVHARLAVGP